MANPVGVDVASFQGNPNWSKAHDAGYSFAYVKTSQWPGYVNPYAKLQRHEAFKAGFQVGNYCYLVAREGRGQIQADWFRANTDWQPYFLIPFLDVEEIGSEGCSPAEIEQCMYDWGRVICATEGIRNVILYTDLNMLHNRIKQTRRIRNMFLLDLADWTLGPPPKVPGWRMVFHQYNTSRGIPGFSGPVDHMRALVPLSTLTFEAMSTHKPPKAIPAKRTRFWQRPQWWLPHL